jgi:hypothetical protein
MPRLGLRLMRGEFPFLFFHSAKRADSRRTITPIRVSHDLLIQFFYSVEGQATSGRSIKGPGELRMMQVKVRLMIPSVSLPYSTPTSPTNVQCCNMVNSLVLPDCKPKYQRS